MSSPALGSNASNRARRRSSLRPLGRLLRNLGGFARDALMTPFVAHTSREWVVLHLDRGVHETEPAGRWVGGWLPTPSPLALPIVREALERIETDRAVRGVLVRAGLAPVGWAKLQSIARGLSRVRERGRRVVVYSTHGANAAAWLGALADHFWMTPEGRLELTGVRLESPFLRGALDRWGIRPLVLQAGRYKGVAEVLERESMSPDSREALEAVADDLYSALVDALSGRAGGEDEARRWIDEGPYLASQAREIGLVDDLVYPDELSTRLRALGTETSSPSERRSPPEDPEAVLRPVATQAYLRLARPRFQWRPVFGPPQLIVVVPILGMIGRDLARTVRAWLEALREREDVAAAVLRIDSPGGDPGASDLIWRAVQRLRERKPVVASLGDTAASGGYYAAMAASSIVAESTTLTGSIGVVMAGVEVAGALAEFGVRFDGVQRGRHAGIYSMTVDRSEEERALLQRQIDHLYRSFVSKAAEGRGLPGEELEAVAQGRVWTGAAAMSRGLVDAGGGLSQALARARELAGMAPDAGEVRWAASSVPTWRRFFSSGDPYEGVWQETPWNARGPQLWCPVQLTLR